MKNSTIILLFTACIGCSELFPLSAQETKKGTIPAKCITSEKQMQQLEESLNNISADLQKKELEFSWLLTERYLNYCDKTNKHINITKDDYLKILTFERKPEDLKVLEDTYENAKKELQELLNSDKEYTRLYTSLKESVNEEARKQASAALSNYYSRRWSDNETYKNLRNKEQKTLRQYRIETVRYALNECKAQQQVMSTRFIDYGDRDNILSSDSALRQLSVEIRLLKDLQQETIRKYQQLKYKVSIPE